LSNSKFHSPNFQDLSEPPEKARAVVAAPLFVGQEDVLAIVAAVGDLMRWLTATTRAGRSIELGWPLS
jgi:hypothetical protein